MMRRMPRDSGNSLFLTTEKTMIDNGLRTWTPHEADAAQQYERLLAALRDAGMTIGRWHDLIPDAAGVVSAYQLRNSLDVLTKLVEDATDTRQPMGAWS
jgi:hypothetical protein